MLFYNLVLLILLGLTACNVEEYPIHRPKNQLRKSTELYEIYYSDAHAAPKTTEINKLKKKLINSGLDRTSTHIALPKLEKTSPYKNRITTLKKILLKNHIKPSQIHEDTTLPSPSKNNLTVLINHYQVIPVNCSGDFQDFSEWHGCTVESNIAAVVADPKVLFEGEKTHETDADMAAKPIQVLKEKQTKSSDKNSSSSSSSLSPQKR